MQTRNVSLTERNSAFLEETVASGRFADANEAVRAGLRLLEMQAAEEQAKLEWLRTTTREAFAALDRGEGIPLTSVEDIDELVTDALREMRAAKLQAHA